MHALMKGYFPMASVAGDLDDPHTESTSFRAFLDPSGYFITARRKDSKTEAVVSKLASTVHG